MFKAPGSYFPPVNLQPPLAAYTSARNVGMFGHVGIYPLWTFIHFAPHAYYTRGIAQVGQGHYFTNGVKTCFDSPTYYSAVNYTYT